MFLYVIAPLLVVLLYFLINLYRQKIDEYQGELATFRDSVTNIVTLELNQAERTVSSFATCRCPGCWAAPWRRARS